MCLSHENTIGHPNWYSCLSYGRFDGETRWATLLQNSRGQVRGQNHLERLG
jgi:hypothetical protein